MGWSTFTCIFESFCDPCHLYVLNKETLAKLTFLYLFVPLCPKNEEIHSKWQIIFNSKIYCLALASFRAKLQTNAEMSEDNNNPMSDHHVYLFFPPSPIPFNEDIFEETTGHHSCSWEIFIVDTLHRFTLALLGQQHGMDTNTDNTVLPHSSISRIKIWHRIRNDIKRTILSVIIKGQTIY